jgi:hypothetical protein
MHIGGLLQRIFHEWIEHMILESTQSAEEPKIGMASLAVGAMILIAQAFPIDGMGGIMAVLVILAVIV